MTDLRRGYQAIRRAGDGNRAGRFPTCPRSPGRLETCPTIVDTRHAQGCAPSCTCTPANALLTQQTLNRHPHVAPWHAVCHYLSPVPICARRIEEGRAVNRTRKR